MSHENHSHQIHAYNSTRWHDHNVRWPFSNLSKCRIEFNWLDTNPCTFLLQSVLPINGVHRAIGTVHSATMAVSVMIRLVTVSALQDLAVSVVNQVSLTFSEPEFNRKTYKKQIIRVCEDDFMYVYLSRKRFFCESRTSIF